GRHQAGHTHTVVRPRNGLVTRGTSARRAHAFGQFGGQSSDTVRTVGFGRLGERRAYDHRAGEAGYLSGLLTVAHTEPDTDGQRRVLARATHQLRGTGTDLVARARHTHDRGGVDETGRRLGRHLQPLIRRRRSDQEDAVQAVLVGGLHPDGGFVGN